MKQILFALLLVSSNVFAEGLVLAQMKEESLPELTAKTEAKADDVKRIHFRINGHGVHHHVPNVSKKSLNNDVYGFNVGYELPYNFIVGVGVFANSMKDYGSNSGRTSNFFQIENRLYKDESWSFYARYRTANNYYLSTYKHSWKQTVGFDACHKLFNTTWDGCITHVLWTEGTKTSASAWVVRTTF